MTAAGSTGNPATRSVARLANAWSNIRQSFALLFRSSRPPGRRPAWPPKGRLAIGAVFAILFVVATVAWLDARSVAGARQLPADVIWLFGHITDLGLSGWFLYPIGIALLVLALADSPSLPEFSRRVLTALSCRLGFVFLAIAVPGLFVAIVKRLIGRARPFVAGDDPWTSALFVWKASYASFPSGHATTAFAAAIAIGAIWRQARPIMWVYAVMIALSRVVVTAHHPSDVIAGAIVGTIGALLVRNWYASRRLGFTVLADGTARPLPGPSWRRIKAVAARAFTA